MASAVKTMPSSISSASTEHRRNGSEAGPRGFTAVNITPPHSRESSATSPDVSPRHGTANTGRQNAYPGGHDQSPHHKRKRSMSSEQALHSPPRYDYNPPKRVDTNRHLADQALHVLDNANHGPPNSNYYSTAPNGQDRQEYSYDRTYSDQNDQNGMQDNVADGRMNEQYQRNNSEQHFSNSSNADDRHQSEDRDQNRSPMVKAQQDAKRKRNFSNRTKTGCITCRSRKKKCDEARPNCNNCMRGGFTCQGYNLTRPTPWPKHTTPPTKPPLLQSKTDEEQNTHREGEASVSATPNASDLSQIRPNMVGDGHEQSRPPPYMTNPPAPADSRPPYSGQPQHQPQPQPQWIQQPQHSQPPQHAPPPPLPPSQHYPTEHLPPLNEVTRPEQQPSYHHHQQQQQQQQIPPPPPQDYNSVPQREMSRPSTQGATNAPPVAMQAPQQWQQQQQQQPQPPPPTHQHPPPPPPPQAHTQPPPQSHQQNPQQEYGTRPNPYPPRINTTQPVYNTSNRLNTANTATANTASASYTSGWEQKTGSKVFLEEDVERSKMIRGANYSYFDPTLKNERQRCSNALLRYNNACQLGSGVSEEAAHSMLQKVFIPALDKTHAFIVTPRLEGLLGPSVIVEQGFKCTYGYNIRLFDNVFIGENTRIDDAGRVEIGCRTWVGANVTILTNDVAKDAIQRKGTEGQLCFSKSVTIGPQVVIGTGAVIYPGVTIGAHATIEPFAIVKHTVGDHVTQKASVGAQAGQPHGYDSGMY